MVRFSVEMADVLTDIFVVFVTAFRERVELIANNFLPNPFQVIFMIRFKSLRHWESHKTNHKIGNMSHNTHNIVTDIKQLKMSLSTPLQAGEGVEVQLHPFSVSVLDECESLLHAPSALPAGKECDANWMGELCGLQSIYGLLRREKSLSPTKNRAPGRPARVLVAIPTTELSVFQFVLKP